MKAKRCLVVIIICSVGLLTSCRNQSDEHKEVMRRWYEELWNKGEVALVDELFAPQTKLPIDTDAIKQAIQERRRAFPDLRYFVKDMIVERNKVVTRWIAHATHHGELRGVPPTERKVSVFGISIGFINQGKIIALWESWDALGALIQIGAVPEKLNISSMMRQKQPESQQNVNQ